MVARARTVRVSAASVTSFAASELLRAAAVDSKAFWLACCALERHSAAANIEEIRPTTRIRLPIRAAGTRPESP